MKKIKIGVMGSDVRAKDIARDALLNDCELVAICECNVKKHEEIRKKFGETVTVYEKFDDFVEHDLDGIVLANFFHEHAPYAIKCFEKGIHVYSECISNGTMAEGVELVRAFEKSNCIYMLAENYPFMKFNREIKRVCDGGSLGKILYAEGEYNHPFNPYSTWALNRLTPFEKHWRNFTPRSYYITHSLGPVMWATGATPKKVTSFSVFAPLPDDAPTAKFAADRVANITTQNDDGSIFRITGCAGYGAEHNSYRVCGTNGQIENLRGMGNNVMLRYNKWSKPEDKDEINLYEPEWNHEQENLIVKTGHGGGDFLAFKMFVDCIRENKQPEHPFDIYSATVMSSVAILAHRSMLEGGKPYDIPDFRKEEDRKLWENDRLTPFYGSDGSEPTLPCCSNKEYKPTEKQMQLFKEALK